MPRGSSCKKVTLLSLWGFLFLTVLLVFGPINDAKAYVDPNAAGPLFQFLFPFFVAITSALVAFRRMVARLWGRMAGKILNTLRGGKDSSYIEDRIDPS